MTTIRELRRDIDALHRTVDELRAMLDAQPSQHESPGAAASGVFVVLLRSVVIDDGSGDPPNSATAHRLRWKSGDAVTLMQPEAFGSELDVHPAPGVVWENLTWSGLEFPLVGSLADEVLDSGRIYPMLAYREGGKTFVIHVIKMPPAKVAVEIGILQSEG